MGLLHNLQVAHMHGLVKLLVGYAVHLFAARGKQDGSLGAGDSEIGESYRQSTLRKAVTMQRCKLIV